MLKAVPLTIVEQGLTSNRETITISADHQLWEQFSAKLTCISSSAMPNWYPNTSLRGALRLWYLHRRQQRLLQWPGQQSQQARDLRARSLDPSSPI